MKGSNDFRCLILRKITKIYPDTVVSSNYLGNQACILKPKRLLAFIGEQREMLQKFSSKMMRSILIYLSKLFLGVDTLFLSRLASVEAVCGGLLVAASLMPLLLPAWMLCSTTTITNRVCRGYGQEKKFSYYVMCAPFIGFLSFFRSHLVDTTIYVRLQLATTKKQQPEFSFPIT